MCLYADTPTDTYTYSSTYVHIHINTVYTHLCTHTRMIAVYSVNSDHPLVVILSIIVNISMHF